jgi:hypothetical protein
VLKYLGAGLVRVLLLENSNLVPVAMPQERRGH